MDIPFDLNIFFIKPIFIGNNFAHLNHGIVLLLLEHKWTVKLLANTKKVTDNSKQTHSNTDFWHSWMPNLFCVDLTLHVLKSFCADMTYPSSTLAQSCCSVQEHIHPNETQVIRYNSIQRKQAKEMVALLLLVIYAWSAVVCAGCSYLR